MDLDPAIFQRLNEQITRERFAAATYTAVSCWADGERFPGLARWAADAATEEQVHAQTLITYVNTRATAQLEPVPAPPAVFDDYAGALHAALTLEQMVTSALTALASAALAAADFATLRLAQTFLDEQRVAENAIQTAIRQVARGAPIDLLDHELFEEAA